MSARHEVDEPGDAALVAAARGGDREAFARLFNHHRSRLAATVGRMLGDPARAEDVVQEAAVTALISLDRLQEPERFGAWLTGIGLNLCRQWIRRGSQREWSWEALQGGLRWDGPPDGWTDPADAVVEAELAERVRAAVAQLPAGQRRAIVLFYFAGLRHREVAGALGIEVGAVKARLHQGRANLRQQLHTTWRSFAMTEETAGRFVPMRPRNVYRIAGGGEAPDAHILVLDEIDGARVLTIWMAGDEAVWLAHALEGVETSRPGPYAVMARLLEESGLALEEVRISRLADEVFHADLVLKRDGRRTSIDARPSDALNLALRLGAPVTASDEVLAMVQASVDRSPGRRTVSRDRVVADAASIVVDAARRQDSLSTALARWDYGESRP